MNNKHSVHRSPVPPPPLLSELRVFSAAVRPTTTRRRGGRTALDRATPQFPSFALFTFAFLSVLDILCLPASLPLAARKAYVRG